MAVLHLEQCLTGTQPLLISCAFPSMTGQNVCCEKGLCCELSVCMHCVITYKTLLSTHQVLAILFYYFYHDVSLSNICPELSICKDLQGLWLLLLFSPCYVNLTCCVICVSFCFLPTCLHSCCWGICGCCWLLQSHVSISIQKVRGSDHSCLRQQDGYPSNLAALLKNITTV